MKWCDSLTYVSAQRKQSETTVSGALEIAEDFLRAGVLHYKEVDQARFVKKLLTLDNTERKTDILLIERNHG